MSDTQFLKSCAEALQREHGPKAFEIVESQMEALHLTNPIAATNWWKIGKHLQR